MSPITCGLNVYAVFAHMYQRLHTDVHIVLQSGHFKGFDHTVMA